MKKEWGGREPEFTILPQVFQYRHEIPKYLTDEDVEKDNGGEEEE